MPSTSYARMRCALRSMRRVMEGGSHTTTEVRAYVREHLEKADAARNVAVGAAACLSDEARYASLPRSPAISKTRARAARGRDSFHRQAHGLLRAPCPAARPFWDAHGTNFVPNIAALHLAAM